LFPYRIFPPVFFDSLKPHSQPAKKREKNNKDKEGRNPPTCLLSSFVVAPLIALHLQQ